MKRKRSEQEKKEADEFWERYNSKTDKDTEVLNKTDIKQSTLSTWKEKRRFPTADDAVKIARVLGKTVEWLVTGNEEENNLTQGELFLLEAYNKLNEDGKKAALGAVRGLVADFPLSGQDGVSTETAS